MGTSTTATATTAVCISIRIGSSASRRSSGGSAQDLIDVLPETIVAATEVVAGPVMGGALLAHTMAGLLDGRRSLSLPPTSFAPLSLTRAASWCCGRSTIVVAGKRVLVADDVRNTGKTFERAKRVHRGGRRPRSSRRPRSTIASRRLWTSACRTSRWPSIGRRTTIPAADCPHVQERRAGDEILRSRLAVS